MSRPSLVPRLSVGGERELFLRAGYQASPDHVQYNTLSKWDLGTRLLQLQEYVSQLEMNFPWKQQLSLAL